MRQAPQKLPAWLSRYLRGFVVRQRGTRALRTAGQVIALATAWLLVACVADRFFQLPESARWVGFGIGALIVIVGLNRAAWQALRPIDWNLAAARIESRTPVFQERLRTVTSQLSAHDPGGASASMLGQTIEEVGRLLPTAPTRQLAPWRLALPAWALAAAAAAALGGATLVPGWHFDLLLARAIFPHRPVEPVTMTRLDVAPRNVRVAPGETLVVSVGITGERAVAALARGVDLYLSADGKTWSRASMNVTDLGGVISRFEFPIPAIERDLRYYVHAGDATSDVYAIKVHRVPAATLFRIRYDYPEYTGHGPVTVTNTDGAIECLANSAATVTVIASEPLSSATWTIGGERFPMSRVSRDEEWQVTFPVPRSANSVLDMVSTAGVAGRGPSPMTARVTVDEAPRPVVLQPTSDLRLSLDDLAAVRFAATDDYGLHAMGCQVRVNGKPVAHASAPVSGRPLRREGEFALDLATLGASVGDVVTLTAEAEDEWRQSKFSAPRTILIAPYSAPPRAYERAAELRRAATLARAWTDSLLKARRALDAARSADPKAARQDPWAAAARAMAVAYDAATALRQSLLRATLRADAPALADALAAWVDQTEAVLVEPNRPLSPASRTDEGLSDRLNSSIARSRDLAAAIDVVQQGERVAAVLPDWLNSKAIAATPRRAAGADPASAEAADLRAAAAEGLKETIDHWLRDASLSLANADLGHQLDARLQRERETFSRVPRLDLVAAARDWANRAARNPGGAAAVEFPARLAAAAQAQALRPGGNAVLARDLALAARSATALNQSTLAPRAPDHPPTGRGKPRPAPVAAYGQFPGALAEVLAGSEAARDQMRAWAGGAADADPADAAERLALAASVADAEGDYAAAADADAGLAREIVRWSPEQSSRFMQLAARALATLQQIEALAREQADVAEALRDGDLAGDALERQAQLAPAIAEVPKLTDVLPIAAAGGAVDATLEREDAAAAAPIVDSPEPSAALAAHRPIHAAAWHARAAADALAAAAEEPTAFAAAMLREQAITHQQQTVALLKVASEHLQRRETLRRLVEVPSLAPLFQPIVGASPTGTDNAVATERIAPRVQDWLRGAAEAPSGAPPKLQEQLQAYFDLISKAQQERK